MKKRTLFSVIEIMNVNRREIRLLIAPEGPAPMAPAPVHGEIVRWVADREQCESRVIESAVTARRAREAAASYRRALAGSRWSIKQDFRPAWSALRRAPSARPPARKP